MSGESMEVHTLPKTLYRVPKQAKDFKQLSKYFYHSTKLEDIHLWRMTFIAKMIATALPTLFSLISLSVSLPVSTTTPALTTTTHQEAQKLDLADIAYLITKVKRTRDSVDGNLDFHCESLEEADFPPEFGKSRCRDYAAFVGTQHVTCSRPISNPAMHNGANTPITTTVVEVLDSVLAHTAMLAGLTELPSYSVAGDCYPITESSPNYFTCVLASDKRGIRRSKRSAQGMLEDLDAPESSIPEGMTCEADASRERKAPLGILWKIQSDSAVHVGNLRQMCETVKMEQGDTSFSCP